MEFNKAAVFDEKPEDPDAGKKLNLDNNPEDEAEYKSQGDINDADN